jgi:hypothetical protein
MLNGLVTRSATTVGPRTFKTLRHFFRLHIQATLGSRLIGTIGQVDMESLYAQMFEGGGVFRPAMLLP